MAYIYAKVDELQGTPLVGSHQCVALVQFYADVPHTAHWRAGAAVYGNSTLPKGTAIATFIDGQYPNHPHGNHAAFYLCQNTVGVWVMDQWAGDGRRKPFVSKRCLPWKGRGQDGLFVDPSNNGDAFAVIERCPET